MLPATNNDNNIEEDNQDKVNTSNKHVPVNNNKIIQHHIWKYLEIKKSCCSYVALDNLHSLASNNLIHCGTVYVQWFVVRSG